MESVDLGVTLAMIGGFGKYQTRLVLILLPITLSGVFTATGVSFIMPAVVCELHMSKYKQGMLFSAVYIGMVLGGFIWGIVSDGYGRRRTLIIILGITALMEISSAFTTNFWELFTTKVFAGFTNSGIMAIFTTYATEFIDEKSRDKMTMAVGCINAFGFFFQPMIAIFILPLRFNYHIYGDIVYLNPWKTFILVCSLAPFCGCFVAAFILNESPAFLLRRGRQQEAMEIVRDIYSVNTGKPPETFPVKKLYLKDDEERLREEKLARQRGEEKSWIGGLFAEMAPLFHFPFLVPALLVFLNQFVTMASYNALKSHQTTIIAMSLGIGQNETATSNRTVWENLPFCSLFETQRIFEKSTYRCSQGSISLNPKLYICSAVVGFFTFVSFIPITEAVEKFGKKWAFLLAHTACAICVSIIPWSSAMGTVSLMSIIFMCQQNCVTINVGLMLGRVPTSLRGVTVALALVCGRFGVVAGSQILPVFTDISCAAGFFCIAFINLMAFPITYLFSRQPNPLKETEMKLINEMEKNRKS